MEKTAFAKRKELLRGKMNIGLKNRIVQFFIWSVVLCGSETRTLLQEDMNRLQAFEMWIWRRMMKVS